ncbi:hypothetical protein C2869_15720 [Saccharobesus litoralis]|uniref:Glycosyltransferase n=1 Tax=Saccharobesus litoralis TaxID=2172099 RepID=A0A2S0VUC5_9ALTE|nr:glycosyltransferase [Saccharobesus litoralis]AWB67783.1 hypothetical protein C2869_15720 [Saccharobesus litoralis]
MKVIFIYQVNEYSVGLAGVFNKMLGQLEAISALGIQTYAIYMSKSDQIFSKFELGQLKPLEIKSNIPKLEQFKLFWKNAASIVLANRFDCVYARYDFMFNTPDLVSFFTEIKEVDCKKVVEFPTFPYEKELINNSTDEIEQDCKNRLALDGKIDFTYSTSHSPVLPNTKNYFFTNKLNTEVFAQAAKNISPLIVNNTIKIITVANNCHWHGFDRIIEGLANYYASEQVITVEYQLVGEGPELNNLAKMVSDKKLDKYVKFHGFKSGDELTQLFSGASIAIASLGLHRIDLFNSSVLKVRLYLANGLPLVYCCQDDDLLSFQYKYRVEENNAPLDINGLVNFVCELDKNKLIRNEIRQFAERNLSWHKFAKDLVQDLLNK